jgi:hypothetical protein
VTLVQDYTAEECETLTERRRGLRITQSRPVKIFDATANRYIAGCTMDTSSSGLRLQMPAWAPVMEGKTLAVYVASAGMPLMNSQSMVPARVVWVGPRKLDGQATVSIGVEFLANVSARLEAA